MKKPEEIKKGLADGLPVHFHASDPEARLTPRNYMAAEGIFADSLALIQQLEAQVPRWISVEERMPETFENVLVYTKEQEILNCHYDDDEWIVNYDGECAGYDYTITHWMPLPEAPKEE